MVSRAFSLQKRTGYYQTKTTTWITGGCLPNVGVL